MEVQKRNVRFPENVYLKFEVFKSGREIQEIAKAIGKSREAVSLTINGHYKGTNIIPLLEKELGLDNAKAVNSNE